MKKELLEELKQKCQACKSCELCQTRNNVVFADGNPDSAKVVLIGEAPGQNEDLSGIPFVGRAGKFLDECLSKAGLSREKDIYIINTVKCRPPKNRVPSAAEKAACEHFMLEQIEVIDPKIILFCGATALKSFSKGTAWGKEAISKIRGEVCEIELRPSAELQQPSLISEEAKKYKAMPIFHPSYLLRKHSTDEDAPRGLMLKDLKRVKGLL